MSFVRSTMGFNNLAKICIFVIAVLLIALVSTRRHDPNPSKATDQPPSLEETAVRFVSLAIMQDLKSAASGGQSFTSAKSGQPFLEWTSIERRTTAKEYEAAYDDNEIAADNEYKDRRILVSGTVAGVEKDFTGVGYLDLAGSNVFFPGVHAQLTQETMQEAAFMKKGQTLNLVCNGAGRVVTIALLNDCKPLADYVSGIAPSVELKVRNALGGKLALSESSRQLMILFYALATSKSLGSECLNVSNTKSCDTEMAAISQDKTRQQALRDKMKQIEPLVKVAH